MEHGGHQLSLNGVSNRVTEVEDGAKTALQWFKLQATLIDNMNYLLFVPANDVGLDSNTGSDEMLQHIEVVVFNL